MTPSAIWSVAAGAFLLPTAVCAQTTDEIQKAAAATIRELGLQTALPGEPQRNSFGWDFDLPYIDFSTWMLWAGLAIGLAIVLYAFRDELPVFGFGRSGKWGSAKAGADDLGQAGGLAQASVSPDDLATNGRHVEAMHLLLLRAIAEIRQRLGEHFADSLTSREILRSARLPDDGRASLRDIINRVELSYFGAYPAAHQDYAACRRSFDALMRVLEGARA